jgi:hypothetical protein
MKFKFFCTFILLGLFVNTFGQTIEKNGTTELEKKVEIYIIEKTNPKFYHTIEFGEKKVFNLNQLINDYKIPVIFSDDPKAHEQNEKAFEWLITFNQESSIAYSMNLTYSLKEKKLDAWDSFWVIVLLDSNLNIIQYFCYAP